MKGLVYKVICQTTGEAYVGKTRSTAQQRWYNHCSEAKRGLDRDLHKSIRKYGADDFQVITLESWDDISNEDLLLAEMRWIESEDTYKNGLNMVLKDESTLPPVPLDKQKEMAVGLQAEVKALITGGVSENTLRNYRFWSKQIQAWLSGRALDDGLLASYITHLHRGGKAPATIAQAVAAVRWQAKNAGTEIVGEVTTRTLAGIRREGQDRGRGQTDGLTWSDVERVCAFAEMDKSIAGLRDSALIRLMSDCLLRVSEAVAVNLEDLKAKTLLVRSSKTDQEGLGEQLYITSDTRRIVRRYCERAGIDSGALFRSVKRGDHIQCGRLTSRSARRQITYWAELAGVEGFISGHSLRVGSAVSLAQAGASVVDMQVAGRWKSSQMPAHYAKAELAERGAIARFKEKRRGG